METPEGLVPDPKRFDNNEDDDDFRTSDEQVETWFLGSLMRDKPKSSEFPDYFRRAHLHNRITHEATDYDERYQTNILVASQLAEFFPYKWLLEITGALRRVDPRQVCVKNHKDRICCYLGYIELYLTFRGLTLLDSTLFEISISQNVTISKDEVRSWKLKLLRITPGLREQWVKVRAHTHQTALFFTVIHVMNKELDLKDCSTEEIFLIKQACLRIARKFIPSEKARHIKKPEAWARAICFKAVYETFPDAPFIPFPHLPSNTLKVLENKKWQLDQVVD